MRRFVGFLILIALITLTACMAARCEEMTPSQVVLKAMEGVQNEKYGVIRKTIHPEDLDKVDDYSDFCGTMIERITRRFAKWDVKSEKITNDTAVVELNLTLAKRSDVVVKEINLKKDESGAWKIKLFFNFSTSRGKDVPECLFDYTDVSISR